MKLVTGIVMASVILSPLGSGIRFDLNTRFQALDRQVSAAVEQGEEAAQKELTVRIKEATEAYILDKADQLGVTVRVRVTLDESTYPVPVMVEVEGPVSPAARAALSQMIQQDLGIPEEDQRWI